MAKLYKCVRLARDTVQKAQYLKMQLSREAGDSNDGGPQGESENTRDRAGNIHTHRTGSGAEKVRSPLRPTMHTEPGSR